MSKILNIRQADVVNYRVQSNQQSSQNYGLSEDKTDNLNYEVSELQINIRKYTSL